MTGIKDFSCVGGLDKHIRIVKETVLFPLMYGAVYAKFNLKPPRGLLFYGPPGTGKTLVASALAAECSSSERKVSFISKKGSDCLSKWVGESEKKLQNIFSTAQQRRPCIIFFDEVDGLAPVRSSRQDFVHVSIVSTLLSLMDGLDNNSEIIVIGATNRIDAIDPALRRSGRFDRELYFPLPCYNARKEILAVHVKSWKNKPPPKFITYLASKTVGFCGSDLQALCAEAVMCCVRRNYPQIYTSNVKCHITDRHLKVEKQDFIKAQQSIAPSSHRVTVVPVRSLSIKVQPLLQDNLSIVLSRLETLCPPGMLTSDYNGDMAASRSASCPRLLLCGDDDCHTRHLGPALLHTLEHLPCHVLDVTTLFEETGRAVEESIIQKMKAARHNLPSLLYIPDMLAWWNLVDDAAKVVFTSLMRNLDRSVHMLVLTTAHCSRAGLPMEIASLYDGNHGEMFEIDPPGVHERQLFFKQLFTTSDSDTASTGSSQADFLQIMSPKKVKNEGGKKQKATLVTIDCNECADGQEVEQFVKRTGMNTKTRNKLGVIQSCHSNMTKGCNGKREISASGEGPGSKKQKLAMGSLLSPSTDKLSQTEVQDLLRRIVRSTEWWSCQQLEGLYDLLELTLQRIGDDAFTEMSECISQFESLRQLNMRDESEYQ